MVERRTVSENGGAHAWLPALVALLLASLLVGAILLQVGGDAYYFVRIGSYYAEGDPSGSKGYDGQFVYYIARNPDPGSAAALLDVPAYRYQRILLPVLARGLSWGDPARIPWVLLLIGLISLAAGTWAVGVYLKMQGVSVWYALVYGLFPGLLLALIVDLPEPLAYALVAWGLVFMEKGKRWQVWLCLGLAAFAKEGMLIFSVAAFLAYLSYKDYRSALGLGFFTGVPFALFQAWLWSQFGSPGINSGGDMATPFEWIPFMGLFRIAEYSLVYFLAMLVVFGPFVLLPTLWGLWNSVLFWLREERHVIVLALGLNAISLLFMPFSTFRETGGLLRYIIGLALTVLFFSAKYQRKRILNYSVFWLVLNAFLIKGW